MNKSSLSQQIKASIVISKPIKSVNRSQALQNSGFNNMCGSHVDYSITKYYILISNLTDGFSYFYLQFLCSRTCFGYSKF